ncbi:MAG: flavin reductase [Ignavibacteria bacterium]|nr:flavin reductase [Ignavibacteria bacterium]
MDITALFRITYGMYVIGTLDGERPTGCIVNTVLQVSAEPLIISVCVNKKNYTNGCIKKTGGFAISILSEQIDPDVIGKMGFNSGKDTDKFTDVAHVFTDDGCPRLVSGISAWLSCEVVESFEIEDYTVFYAKVNDSANDLHKPMTYDYYHRVVKGKTAPNAPTFVPPQAEQTVAIPVADKKQWICGTCAYTYSGGVPFENLPEDWRCPLCGRPKSGFKNE